MKFILPFAALLALVSATPLKEEDITITSLSASSSQPAHPEITVAPRAEEQKADEKFWSYLDSAGISLTFTLTANPWEVRPTSMPDKLNARQEQHGHRIHGSFSG